MGAVQGDNTIWWTSLCGNQSIDWAFWSDRMTINTTSPDLSQCFQHTALVWIPSSFLLFFGTLYVCYISRQKTENFWRQKTRKNILKLLLCLCTMVTCIIDIVSILSDEGTWTNPPARLLAPIVRMLTLAYAGFIIHYEFKKGEHSSGVMFLFWFLSSLFGIVPARTLYMREEEIEPPFRYTLFYVQYGITVVIFLLHLVSDLGAIPSMRNDTETYHSNKYETTPLLASTEVEKPTSKANACPMLTAHFLSRIYFFWMTSLIWTGYKRPVVDSDLWELREEDKTKPLIERFLKEWDKQTNAGHALTVGKYKRLTSTSPLSKGSPPYQQIPVLGVQNDPYGFPKSFRPEPDMDESSSSGPSLIRALWNTLGRKYIICALLEGCTALTVVVYPHILRWLLNWFVMDNTHQWHGYVIALTFLIFGLVRFVILSNVLFRECVVGMQMRSIISAAVYRKSLRLSNGARKKTTVGEIVNLMSVDAQKLQDVPVYINTVWISPCLVILVAYFLYDLLGLASLSGLVVMVIMGPVLGIFSGNRILDIQVLQMVAKDARIKLMSQVLAGIKVLKLYAWERSFEEMIRRAREEELDTVQAGYWLQTLTTISAWTAPSVVAVVTFATYILMDPNNVLDAEKAFVSLSFINSLNWILFIMPNAVYYLGQAIVSFRRVDRFLKQDELEPDAVQREYTPGYSLVVQDGCFTWDPEELPIMRNINLSVKDGSLIAVVGQVGSGKSSLISAMLGEMYKVSGRVNVKGSVAYVSQQAWMRNDTLRGNILFGQSSNTEKYNRILEACALVPDLKILPGGDMTEIGEKGINMSGGQKQRVSLARAVYANADVYLLDDPLSAVDANVGKSIFEEVIGPNGLLRNRTRILVTHSLTFLPNVDSVAVIKNGEISEMGHYEELLRRNGAFAEYVQTYLMDMADNDDSEAESEAKEDQEVIRLFKAKMSDVSGDETVTESEGFSDIGTTTRRRKNRRPRGTKGTKDILDSAQPAKKVTLIEEETAETGEVKSDVLKGYFKSAGIGRCIFVLVMHALYAVTQILANIWLSEWSNDKFRNQTEAEGMVPLRLGVYGGLSAASFLSAAIECVIQVLAFVSACRVLHNLMVHKVMRAPTSFFDVTPLGRIMNRCSKDMDNVDSMIPPWMRSYLQSFLPLLTTSVVIAYSTPIFLLVAVPLGIVFYSLQKMYIRSVRQLKRIDAIKRSPIYAHFDESLVGVSTIRAFREQERFIDISDKILDESQMAWFPIIASYRWLGVILDGTGNMTVFFASLFAVLQKDSLNSGLVGLSISFALQVTFGLALLVRSATELETYIVSVERVYEYKDLPAERDWVVPHTRPDPSWPHNGEVVFDNYCTRYRPGLDLVLRGIDCKITAGHKVGIVGRTGAGKSSLTLALFRIVEAASGSIIIDGIDISTLGLHDLRSQLTIIPQDPVLFSGSLRLNIDPFDTYTDSDIWRVLTHAHLKTFVESLPQGLEYECGEGGDNLSIGQRQLVCLARALLRRTKILVLDEATAAVDLETDDLIQSTIKSEFHGSTVITIAHRLNTILDYDEVMVLDRGKIREYDAPSSLLKNKRTLFFNMVQDAGLI